MRKIGIKWAPKPLKPAEHVCTEENPSSLPEVLLCHSHRCLPDDTDQEQMPSTLPQTPNDNCGNANGLNCVANLANMHQHQMGNAPPNPGNQNDQLLDASD